MKYLIVSTESFQSGEVPDAVKAYITRHRNPFIILDESSKIKTNNACKEEKKSKRNLAIRRLNKFGHRCILTGTFMTKSPVNAYDQMDFLKKGFFPETMFEFQSRYVIMMTLPIGRGIKTQISEEVYEKIHKRLNNAFDKGGKDKLALAMESVFNFYKISETKLLHIMQNEEYSPFMNVADLYKRIGDVCMVVKKKDAMDIPPKVYITRKIDLTSEMKTLYKKLLDDGFAEEIVIDNTMSLYHRFQDICNGYIPYDDPDNEGKVLLKRQKENVKIEEILETLEEIDTKEHQVVVWANRTMFLEDIYEAITKAGYTCCLYNGDTKAAEKDRIKEDFKSRKIQVFIGNQASGAFGLDFLKKANYAIYASNDCSVENREQSEDRIEREEGQAAKTIIDIVTSGTIDERNVANLKIGKELIKAGKTDRAMFALQEEVEW